VLQRNGAARAESALTHAYTYGSVYTLTRTNYITVTSAAPVQTTTVITYTYDPLNRLTGAAYSDDTFFAYQYDAVGNREALTTTAGVVTYIYDAANRLTSVGGETYTWDNRGNLTHDGTFTYTYDAAGRLVGAQSITSTLVYTYNGDGVRVAMAVDGVETRWVQDVTGLPEVLSEASGGSAMLYVYGAARLSQVEDGA